MIEEVGRVETYNRDVMRMRELPCPGEVIRITKLKSDKVAP
jgi:hypothetical protein